MKVSTNELLLALRAPSAGWLAALVCALDEALQDPDFGEPQRAMVRALLDRGAVPSSVVDAANLRLAQFEKSVCDLPPLFDLADEPMTPARPKLTICGGTG